jgi:chromosome segregation protein
MLKRLEIAGFKSFARKTVLDFSSSVTSIVGPNGSGKSNVAEAFRFALGEQSMKSMRGKRSEDLIFSGSHTAPRSNRAAVAVVFDNSRKQFKLDFDEVVIERAVFRDGTSEYSINGSKARLRDIQELLAGANIGETSHHIISQGEADRILAASNADRREMLEEALGLKIFEFKKQESEKKLSKTEENIAQVEALRRELAPHVKFLGKQVEKLERADEMRRELTNASKNYLAIEDAYLREERKSTETKKASAAERLALASAELGAITESTIGDEQSLRRAEAVRQAESSVERITSARGELAHSIGKVEGALEGAKKRQLAIAHEPYAKIPREDLTALRDEVERQVGQAGENAESLKAVLIALRSALRAFFERFVVAGEEYLADEEKEVLGLEDDRTRLLAKDVELEKELERARSALARAREESRAVEESGRESRHRTLALAQAKATEEAEVVRLAGRARELAQLAEELQRDTAEILALGGAEAVSYLPLAEVPVEERRVQEDRKRALERLKIRLEEAGGGGEEIRQEYKEVSERESFLARELEDLAKSAGGLRELIAELDTELGKSFAEGLTKVNASFGEFFALMFGGGSARLVLEEPEESEEDEESESDAPRKEVRAGIEISVNLPKKRVQSLMQLSGGERALTSIALIFAMSQVNPPPFLILDETDAALDEANSRRYGDMIENLSKKSQLIVITHNRETMSRAGILYGVTMSGDGVSKLLSVKFDEAVAVAK